MKSRPGAAGQAVMVTDRSRRMGKHMATSCGVLSAEVRAGRNKHAGIEDAAIRLRDMMDELDH
jgi:hypothetical protein